MGRYTARLSTLSRGQLKRLAARIAEVTRSSDLRLIAYVVPRPNATLDEGELKAFVRSELPEYMVPGAFVALDALPLGPTGKVNRDALPYPRARGHEDPRDPPQGAIEEALAVVWQHVLAVPRVWRDDDFFANLNGHSLLAARLLASIRERMGVTIPLQELFESPTIAKLASIIERGLRAPATDADEPTIRKISRDDRRMRLEPER